MAVRDLSGNGLNHDVGALPTGYLELDRLKLLAILQSDDTDIDTEIASKATGGLADGSITLAKLADIGQGTVLGRASGAGTGVPQALSAAQTKTALSLNNVDNTADTGKPVSTAQQTALDAKLNLAGGTLTGGAKVPGGSVSGALTSAAHSGGIFTTSNNVTVPNEAGFSITLIAGGAHTVGAGGATISLASGDVISIVIPAVGTVRYVKVLAANVGTLATS